ncbi:MAG TPA: hypothetical protein VM165_20905 [Planctomycetaceae bacterium]|nr:hypothetical protein [Planctomycetaceae bacterium]
MVRRLIAVSWTVAVLATGLAMVTQPLVGHSAEKRAKRPVKVLKHDPNAAEVELFDAIEAGQLEVKVVPKNAFGSNVLIENKTDKPLTVKLPQAVVAVPKHLAQFGGGGGGLGGGGFGGGGQGGGQQGGGQQAQGGGLGGGGLGGGGGMMGGGGFMGGGGGGFGSIPPETVASIPLNGVCLQHGKPDPTSRSEYVLIPVENFSDDPVLHHLLAIVGTKQIDPQAAQAAVWHLTDKMSWEQLAAKSTTHVGGLPPTRYFSPAQLEAAYALLNAAKETVKDAPRTTPRKPIRPAVDTPAE